MKNSFMNREFYDLSNGALFAKIGPLVAEISPKMCFKWDFACIISVQNTQILRSFVPLYTT